MISDDLFDPRLIHVMTQQSSMLVNSLVINMLGAECSDDVIELLVFSLFLMYGCAYVDVVMYLGSANIVILVEGLSFSSSNMAQVFNRVLLEREYE